MALQYKLEPIYEGGSPADDSIFIQLRYNPPVYRSRTDKEDYDVLPEEEKHPFLTMLYNVAGVTEVSCRAYRVWVMKSPVYSWQEVLTPTLHLMKDWFSEDSLEPLPGSAELDGKGARLDNVDQRRNR